MIIMSLAKHLYREDGMLAMRPDRVLTIGMD
jgi:hypothetical protein